MITLTRRQARRLRVVFRRSVLGLAPRGPVPPLVLRAEGGLLRAEQRHGGLIVAHVEPGSYRPNEAIALPLDALADVEGRDESPVVLEAESPTSTVARWEDKGVPQSRRHALPTLIAPEPVDLPRSWHDAPAGLLDALAEATRTGSEDSTRYALDCLLLRGATGEIVATDGRQLLVQGGFAFPWPGDVLVKRSPILSSKELPRDRPLSLGKTATHVVLRAGAWTLHLDVQEARFPKVEQVIPDEGAAATRLSLDGGDAAFLAHALGSLPGGDEANSPATLDLNGRIAVRARDADQPRATELVLARSRYTGAAIRINANRDYLARALRLGFTELEVVDADAPVVCRDARRIYCFQPLSKESALAPADDVTRIESVTQLPSVAPRQEESPHTRTTMSERIIPTNNTRSNGATNGHDVPDVPGATSLVALIQEAEALHQALADARTRTGRLAVALRRYRRRERLVSTTLASLQALKLQDVAE